MPELPEVETIAQQIRDRYIGKRMIDIDTKPIAIFQNTTAGEFKKELKGKKLNAIKRYGKFLYWEVEGIYPVFHLGMSGIFISDKSQSKFPQHIHISMKFDQHLYLYFQDVRKFSKIYLYHAAPDFTTQLGIDPTRENFTLINFKKLLNLKSIMIKSFLMDQKIIAGIGNIYANEILYDANIHPVRPANTIDGKEAARLYRSIKKIIQLAIERFGTSYSMYRTIGGETGRNQNFLKVYQKEGSICTECGTKIEKLWINNRSTFYCSKCQIK